MRPEISGFRGTASRSALKSPLRPASSAPLRHQPGNAAQCRDILEMGRAQAGLRPLLTTGYDLGGGAKAQGGVRLDTENPPI